MEFSAAITKDDVKKLELVASKYKELLTIENKELAEIVVSNDESCSKKTLLQEALEKDKREVVAHLVSKCSISYFLDDYPEFVRKVGEGGWGL